ncbi:nitrate reductase molybdenum cofactor assembly chaperone [Lacticaseibacillus baoqingensis]|uniref:Nitrate reductase molybdenum cofactor assembly chaperone n=1 Tax=Lacticaseibacillus baoqingensis TaxID=2486013 RepID=A0ABW4EBP5_9LACO|nr:nitrate reductase molybdenum cofactor assembly chaperone [Lacticaseibacillus baoqingensis]
MINIQKLDTVKTGFTYLSRLLDYPTAELLTPAFTAGLQQDYAPTAHKTALLALLAELQQESLAELQTHYVGLFELNNRYTLYMTYYKLTDSRERGQVLARLKMLYEMFGVRVQGTELPDYLPLMLEFLAYSDWQTDARQQDLSLLFAVIEDGTHELLKRAAVAAADPYFRLVALVRAEFKDCLAPAAKGVS